MGHVGKLKKFVSDQFKLNCHESVHSNGAGQLD